MPPVNAEPKVLNIRSSNDVVIVRQTVRGIAISLGFSIVDQTKVVTAASEMARNTLEHGKGGTARIETVEEGSRRGLRMVFEDQGPGISDIKLALTDGYTTGSGLGLGLSGSKRLVNDFDIWSEVGVGTRVTLTKWK